MTIKDKKYKSRGINYSLMTDSNNHDLQYYKFKKIMGSPARPKLYYYIMKR